MSTIRVLIVDDDVPTRVGLRTILSTEADLEVVGEATTSADAVRLAKDLAPDVVLMDVRLGEDDGITATSLITKTFPTGPPRVIVLTTFDVDEYVYRSVEAGASGYLLKRTPAEALIDAVRTVADGSALAMPEAMRELIDRFAGSSAGARGNRFVAPLTDREREVLVLIARGLSNQEIADELHVSLETVRTHVKRVYAKCGARDRAHAVIAAYESGLVQGNR